MKITRFAALLLLLCSPNVISVARAWDARPPLTNLAGASQMPTGTDSILIVVNNATLPPDTGNNTVTPLFTVGVKDVTENIFSINAVNIKHESNPSTLNVLPAAFELAIQDSKGVPITSYQTLDPGYYANFGNCRRKHRLRLFLSPEMVWFESRSYSGTVGCTQITSTVKEPGTLQQPVYFGIGSQGVETLFTLRDTIAGQIAKSLDVTADQISFYAYSQIVLRNNINTNYSSRKDPAFTVPVIWYNSLNR